ncbi:hypothetical protein INT47_000246 [Mucor saturninus]|uniref:Uncharacterized protein n=1 Tax=Mucor saturninus TaxID=64648 RepID=A0A8H7UXM2_9FUNG|nr:hypothetical protein INT47_000246 [Mucor saturninus]
MFKTPAATRLSYFSWLPTAGQLSPAYDYFDFANTFDGNQRCINRWYSNTMKKALEDAKGADKFEIAQKINQFNVAAAACGGGAANDNSGNDGASSSSTDHSLRDTNEKVTEDLECHSFDELGEKFIFLDKDSTHHNEAAQILASPTKLPNKPLTHVCQLLLDKLANCAPSSRLMRKLIRSNTLNMDEPFDLSIHADLNFTEVMCTHFLNLMDSPRNPMQQQQMERNTAFLTTIPILHNMFIDCNDIIDMQWQSVIPLLVELSGGIDHNSGTEKAQGDEEKMIRQLIKLLKIKKAEGSDLPHQYYIRYHDLKIHFESLFYFGEYYVKRTYFELLCPTTPNQLKKFVERIPDLFRYRQALLDQLNT